MNDFSAASEPPDTGYAALLVVMFLIPFILYFLNKIITSRPETVTYLDIEIAEPKPRVVYVTPPQKHKPLPKVVIPQSKPIPVKREPVKISNTPQEIIDAACSNMMALGFKKGEALGIINKLTADKDYSNSDDLLLDSFKRN